MSYPKRVVFFNPANNGDIHVSRELVRYTMGKIRIVAPFTEFFYAHKNSVALIRDIDVLPFEDLKLKSDVRSTKIDPDTLVLNTWYAVSPSWKGRGNGFGITLHTLVALFNAHLKEHYSMGISEGDEKFIPKINWGCFDLAQAKKQIPEGKKVLFCNNKPMSAQSHVPDEEMNGLLKILARRYPQTTFIRTNDFQHHIPNVVSSQGLIGPTPWGNDLNETAWIGTKCDVIIGRGSGPQTFCFNADSLLDATKTFITFVDDERLAQWVLSELPARRLWSPETQADKLADFCAEALRG